MKIFGFHGGVPALVALDELKLTCLWRQRWEAAGFEPVILNEWQAMRHPYFEEYKAAIDKLPSVNPAPYEWYCYCRWLALARVGGGYMSDSDLIPYPPYPPAIKFDRVSDISDRLQMFDLRTPSLVYASKHVAERICQEFASGKWGKREINGREHFSDMYALEDMGNLDGFIDRHDIVKNYKDDGWETAPMVHYSKSAMDGDGRLPKWRHIPKLRK